MSRTNNWIHTYTGKKFYPFDPDPADVCIEDIAHALSLQCRFTGHCAYFYSVAQHSVLVANLVPDHALWGLLHDASEAYLIDVARPLKHADEFRVYREVEERVMKAVCTRFGLNPIQPNEVTIADNAALSIEAHQLMGDVSDWEIPTPLDGWRVIESYPSQAEWDFKRRFWLLTGAYGSAS